MRQTSKNVFLVIFRVTSKQLKIAAFSKNYVQQKSFLNIKYFMPKQKLNIIGSMKGQIRISYIFNKTCNI
jgi:hypothetical protein